MSAFTAIAVNYTILKDIMKCGYVNVSVFIQWLNLIHTNFLQPQTAHITNIQISLMHCRSPTNM